MTTFDVVALLFLLSALYGWLNARFLKLPHVIGLLLLSVIGTLLLLSIDLILPGSPVLGTLGAAFAKINFADFMMDGALALILFAGAIDLNLAALRDRASSVAILAVFGTAASTLLVGGAIWLVSGWIGQPLPLVWALLFGVIISPTDPVAVLSTLKGIDISDRLRVEMQGEALFNDGIAVVLFALLLGVAMGGSDVTAGGLALDLLREAGGGIALGLVTGTIAIGAMRQLDDHRVEMLISLALVTGTYALAHQLGTSGPLAVVAAGIVVGARGRHSAMSDETLHYFDKLWMLIDELLNSVLFVIIGLEVILLTAAPRAAGLAFAAIPIVLIARWLAIASPLAVPALRVRRSIRNVPFLVWAGVRGAVSVALVLSLPDVPYRPVLLEATYVVVLFSILVQGLTLGKVARRLPAHD